MHQRIYFFVYLQVKFLSYYLVLYSIQLTFKACLFNDLFILWAVANLFSLDYFTLIRSRRPSTLLRPIAGLKETKIHLNYQEQQNK